jgi:uncharacterized repeat protein (TIGR04138 family)
MAAGGELQRKTVLQKVVEDSGLYPAEAYEFVQRGLTYTVQKLHGSAARSGPSRHVTGQQLCEGLRELAMSQWGYLAQTVLQRWNITSTLDFGRIVFNLVRHRAMATTQHDSIDDFRNVYDFKSAFESRYRIPLGKI